jgi:antitoxin (DNA-binding transcriptional repressor) of toxin-antitoxin stability system
MDVVNATELKNRLGAVLERATLGRVAIERHGQIVAYLVPASAQSKRAIVDRSASAKSSWSRRQEERVVELCANEDFRPSRWLRAGNRYELAGVAAMLASHADFDRSRMLALAERLHPGMSTTTIFNRWLARTPIHAARLLPMLRQRESSDAHGLKTSL